MRILFIHNQNGWERYHIADDLKKQHDVCFINQSPYLRGSLPPYYFGENKPIEDLQSDISVFNPDVVFLGPAQLIQRQDVWDFFDSMNIPMMTLHCNAVGKPDAWYDWAKHVYGWCTELVAKRKIVDLGGKAEYVAFGANPDICYKKPELSKKYDVTFASSHVSGRRNEFIQYLKKNNINAQAKANIGMQTSFNITNATPYNVLNDVYNSSIINLGFSQPNNEGKLRHQEVPVSGNFYLVEACEQLTPYYVCDNYKNINDKTQLVVWNDKEQLLQSCRFLLDNLDILREVQANMIERAKHYTPRYMFNQFLEKSGLRK